MSNKQTTHPTETPTKGGRRSVARTSSADRWEPGKVGIDYGVVRCVLTWLSTLGRVDFDCEELKDVTIPPNSDHLRLSSDDDDINMFHFVSMAYAQSFMDNNDDEEFNGSNNKEWHKNVTHIPRYGGDATSALLTDIRMIIGAMYFHHIKISIYEHATQQMTRLCDLVNNEDAFNNTIHEIILTRWKRPNGTIIDLQWTPKFVDINRLLFSADTNPFTPSDEHVAFVEDIINSLTQDKEPDIDDHFAGAFAIIPLHILQMPGVLKLVLGRILPKLFEIMRREEYTGPNTMTSGVLNELLEASVGKGFNYKQYVSEVNPGSDDDSDNGFIVDEDGETKLNKKNQRGVYYQVSHKTIGDRREQFEEFISRQGSDNTYNTLVKHMKRWLESNKEVDDDEQPDNQLYVGMAAKQSIWKRWAQEASTTKKDGASLLWLFTLAFKMDFRLVLVQVEEGSTRLGLFYEGLILGILQCTAKRTRPEFKLLSKPNGSALNQINGGLAGFVRKGAGGKDFLVDWFKKNSEILGDQLVASSLEIPANVASYLWYWENDVLEFLTGNTPHSPVSKQWGELEDVRGIGDVSVMMLHSFMSMRGGKECVSEPMLEARLLVHDTSITSRDDAEKVCEQLDVIFNKWTVNGESPGEATMVARWKSLIDHVSLDKGAFIKQVRESIKDVAFEDTKKSIETTTEEEKNEVDDGFAKLMRLSMGKKNKE